MEQEPGNFSPDNWVRHALGYSEHGEYPARIRNCPRIYQFWERTIDRPQSLLLKPAQTIGAPFFFFFFSNELHMYPVYLPGRIHVQYFVPKTERVRVDIRSTKHCIIYTALGSRQGVLDISQICCFSGSCLWSRSLFCDVVHGFIASGLAGVIDGLCPSAWFDRVRKSMYPLVIVLIL